MIGRARLTRPCLSRFTFALQRTYNVTYRVAGAATDRYNQCVRLIAALVAMSTILSAADLTIDHVTVAGKDLKAMQASLAALGIRSEYGGRHQNHATEMAITSFPDGSYLELIALQPDADPKAVAAHYWSKQMEGDAGPCAWAIRPKDMAAEIARLRAAGVRVGDSVRSGRLRPDGRRLDWETADIGAEPNGTFFPFMIRDFSPRDLRAYLDGSPTTTDFGGVRRVVIAVRDLKVSVDRYRKAFDLPATAEQVEEGFGARLAEFRGTPVVLAEPLNSDSWIARRIARFGEGPCAFVLGSEHPERFKTIRKSRWFGTPVSWFDDGQLGWRLGVVP